MATLYAIWCLYFFLLFHRLLYLKTLTRTTLWLVHMFSMCAGGWMRSTQFTRQSTNQLSSDVNWLSWMRSAAMWKQPNRLCGDANKINIAAYTAASRFGSKYVLFIIYIYNKLLITCTTRTHDVLLKYVTINGRDKYIWTDAVATAIRRCRCHRRRRTSFRYWAHKMRAFCIK